MSVSIFDLPHVLEHICTGLSREDFASCTLVCYAWSQVLRPLSWRHFELGDVDYDAILQHPDSILTLQERAPTIHTLTVRYSSTLWRLLDYLDQHPGHFSHHLRQIVILAGKESDAVGSTKLTLRLLALTEGLSLQHLEINTTVSSLWRFAQQLELHFSHAQALRTLVLKGEGQLAASGLATLLRYCPTSLELLQIDYPVNEVHERISLWGFMDAPNAFGHFPDDGEGLELFWQHATETNIKTLQLPRTVRNNELTTVVPFLRRRCPHLTTWGPMSLVHPSAGRAIAEALWLHCPKLQHLTFHDLLQEMLPVYGQIIRATHALKSLTVTGKVHTASSVVQAVVQYHARTIARIRWTGGGGFFGGIDMEDILRTCSSLERMEFVFEQTNNFFTGQGASGSLWITSGPLPTKNESLQEQQQEQEQGQEQEMPMLSNLMLTTLSLSPPTLPSLPTPRCLSTYFWACHATLTHLDATFYPSNHVLNERQFRQQIEHTYRKLGQLAVLQVLRLGCRCRCYGPQLRTCRHFQYNAVNGADDIRNDDQLSGSSLATTSATSSTKVDHETILDMSLATGLAHLSGLKQLQFLCIAKIQGHKIGYPELEWMCKNWPLLRELRGVRNTRIMDWIEHQWRGVRVLYLSS